MNTGQFMLLCSNGCRLLKKLAEATRPGAGRTNEQARIQRQKRYDERAAVKSEFEIIKIEGSVLAISTACESLFAAETELRSSSTHQKKHRMHRIHRTEEAGPVVPIPDPGVNPWAE